MRPDACAIRGRWAGDAVSSPLGRIVEIAEEGRHLSKKRGFLVVSEGHAEAGRAPLDDIAAVLATARGTSVSVALLTALAERGLPFVVPGANFVPAALLWPVAGHHAVSRRMAAQIERTRPMEKRLWALVAAAKISSAGLGAAMQRTAGRGVRPAGPRCQSG